MKKLSCIFFLAMLSTRVVWAQCDLKITEIMYNAPANGAIPGSYYEYLELKNTGTATLDLSNYKILDGVTYVFPFGSSLESGELLILAADSFGIQQRYPGVKVFDQYVGGLKAGGEAILILDGVNDTCVSFTYNDQLPWPILADGNGHSMVSFDTNPSDNQQGPGSWRNSTNEFGSPGEDDPEPPIVPGVLVNEVLPNTVLPELDQVELYNPLDSTVDISYWYVTDNKQNPFKFQIPAGTFISSEGYVVFDESDFGAFFSFSGSGESAYLFSADSDGNLTGGVDGFDYRPQFPGNSVGRYTNSVGTEKIATLESQTFGAENSDAFVGDVVFDKIMYNSIPNFPNFITLTNTSSQAVDLFHPVATNNTWQIEGAGFTFPSGVTIDAGETIFLSDTIESTFRDMYELSTNSQVFVFTGRLQNNGETLRLSAPDDEDTVTVVPLVLEAPMVAVDEVKYSDDAPWPVEADGSGSYLSRVDQLAYACDPNNWSASIDVINALFGTVKESYVLIYPNPSSDFIQVDGIASGTDFVIYSSDGMKQMSGVYIDSAVNISTLHPGQYVMTCNDENMLSTIQFSIVR